MPLSPPPRDVNNLVIPHDHAEILAEDGLIRRIPPQWVVDDVKSPTGKRLSSEAFEMSSPECGGGMSVDIRRLIIEAGQDIKAHVTMPPWIGSIQVTAGQLRGYNLQVGFSPLPTNPFHGEAWGKISKKQSKALRLASTWIVEINGCSLEA
ncbi:hypothetical protein ACWYXK_25560 [Janthinobacterium lividum]|uniref:hypothetical protein n=1 Tax=Janthinobacterium TaxID=29580 RepID=UPI001179BF55|nr:MULTISPECIES: hypothetical protein [Janthinobacterium]MBR7633907.1 hypothetical protein [Janthinobacterium lividum]QKY06753.1 hypothetical protein G8765_02500 [Janthinobacterium lividum]